MQDYVDAPVRIEQQPTQPMEQQAQTLEERATQPVVTVIHKKRYEEQPTLALSIFGATLRLPASRSAVSRRPNWKLRLSILIPLNGLLIVAILVGRAVAVNWVTARSAAPQSTPIIMHVHRTASKSSLIVTDAHDFMDAMVHKSWAAMWSMLSPAAQSLYQDERDFEHFEQAKFGKVTFLSFESGAAQLLQPWFDPDTTRIYPLAAVIHVSLDATVPRGVLTGPSRTALVDGLFHDTLLSMVPSGGKWWIMLAGPADLEAPVLVPAAPLHVRLLVPLFMYHHVTNKPQLNLLNYNLTVTTTDFNTQLDWLQARGYHSIDLTELFDALYYGKALPSHPMILTFDDGYEDMYTDALPELLAHRYRGVFFIITGMIGGSYMTWNQVRVLAGYGMQIASHTIHHVNIGQPPPYTTTQKELQQSKATLQAQLGGPIQFFCYPTGEPFHNDSYYEQQLVLSDLQADGYVGATLDPFSFDAAIQDAQTPYELPRVRVSGGESLQAFTGILDVVLQNDATLLKQTAA